MSIQETLQHELFEHNIQEIVGRINAMAKRGEQGFAGHFVSGYQLHENQDRAIASYYGLDVVMSRGHTVLPSSMGNILLKREVICSTAANDQSQDSVLQTGVTYSLHMPDII